MKNNRRLCSLVLLDPFGMQLKWDSIKQLDGTRTDLWILIPSGITNRLLDTEGKLNSINKLVTSFGLPDKEIREHFYRQDISQHTLFDIGNEIRKISASA